MVEETRKALLECHKKLSNGEPLDYEIGKVLWNSIYVLLLDRAKKWDLGENSHLVLSLGEIEDERTFK